MSGVFANDPWNTYWVGDSRSAWPLILEGSFLVLIFGTPLFLLLLSKTRQAYRERSDFPEEHRKLLRPSRLATVLLGGLLLSGVFAGYDANVIRVSVRRIYIKRHDGLWHRWQSDVETICFGYYRDPHYLRRVVIKENVPASEKPSTSPIILPRGESSGWVSDLYLLYFLRPPVDPVTLPNIFIVRKNHSVISVPRRATLDNISRILQTKDEAEDADDLARRLEELLPLLE